VVVVEDRVDDSLEVELLLALAAEAELLVDVEDVEAEEVDDEKLLELDPEKGLL